MKGKEALERIKSRTAPYYLGLYEKEDYLEDLKIIEDDLKVLEIIKKHEPSFFRLKICKTKEEYNRIYIDGNFLNKRILTEEEFKLLKGMLENE